VRFALTLALILAEPSFAADSTLSDADEIRIGHVLAGKYAKARGLATTPQVKRIEKYLQTVGDRVAANAPRRLPYHFHYDPDPAFKSSVALPGGEIYAGAGILAFLESEDQLATVLGHEIGHVALNQCRDRLVSVLAARHLSPIEADRLGAEQFFASYGPDGELAADGEGVKLAAAAGYSPQSAVRLLATFLLLAERTASTPDDLKTTLQERIAQIRAVIERDKLPIPSREKPLVLP
jgi:predicted Zn-dependent protease